MEASNVKLLPSLSFLEYHNHVLETWKAQLHLLPASKAWVLVIFAIRFQLHNINRLFEAQIHVAVGITNVSNTETSGRETSTLYNSHHLAEVLPTHCFPLTDFSG